MFVAGAPTMLMIGPTMSVFGENSSCRTPTFFSKWQKGPSATSISPKASSFSLSDADLLSSSSERKPTDTQKGRPCLPPRLEAEAEEAQEAAQPLASPATEKINTETSSGTAGGLGLTGPRSEEMRRSQAQAHSLGSVPPAKGGYEDSVSCTCLFRYKLATLATSRTSSTVSRSSLASHACTRMLHFSPRVLKKLPIDALCPKLPAFVPCDLSPWLEPSWRLPGAQQEQGLSQDAGTIRALGTGDLKTRGSCSAAADLCTAHR